MEHCPRCGRPGTHDDCRAALAYEAPRFCEQCGRRLRVQVYPDGYTASCRDHGPASGSLPPPP